MEGFVKNVRVFAAALLVSIAVATSVSRAEPPVGAGAAVAEREERPLGKPAGKPDLPSLANPGAKSTSLIDHPLVRTGGSLGVVLALIYGLAKLAQRYGAGGRGGALAGALGGGPSPAGVLEILGRYPVGRGQTLLLLRVDNRVLLLAQTAPGFRLRGGSAGSATLTTLCEMTNPEDVASILIKVQDAEQASAAARFGELLGRADARHEGTGVVEVGAAGVGRRARVSAIAEPEEVFGVAGGSPLRERLQAMRAGGGR